MLWRGYQQLYGRILMGSDILDIKECLHFALLKIGINQNRGNCKIFIIKISLFEIVHIKLGVG
jgi:hypothetical protein